MAVSTPKPYKHPFRGFYKGYHGGFSLGAPLSRKEFLGVCHSTVNKEPLWMSIKIGGLGYRASGCYKKDRSFRV